MCSPNLKPSLTINLLQFLDVVQYFTVVDDKEREDDEVVGGYNGSVAHNQLPQFSSVHVERCITRWSRDLHMCINKRHKEYCTCTFAITSDTCNVTIKCTQGVMWSLRGVVLCTIISLWTINWGTTTTAVTKSSLIRVEIILTWQICLCVSMSLCFEALCPECLEAIYSYYSWASSNRTIRICYIHVLAWQCLHTTVNTYVYIISRLVYLPSEQLVRY